MRSTFEYGDSLNVVKTFLFLLSELMNDDAEQMCANSCTDFFFHSVTWTLNKVTPESDYTLKVQEFYLQRLFDWAKKQIVKQIRWH